MTKFPETPPETAEEVWHALLPVLDALLHRVAQLEALTAGLHTLGSVPLGGQQHRFSQPVSDPYQSWMRRHAERVGELVVHACAVISPQEKVELHRRFVPDYDSEGAY